MWRKFKFDCNPTRITGTVHEEVCTLMIISRSVLVMMRNVADESCRQDQNTYIMFNNFFPPKIVPFMVLCGKI